MAYTLQRSEPLYIGSRELRLYSRALRIAFPWHLGGIVWNRPVFFSVKTSAGQEQVLPIRDTTRLVQLGLLAACLTTLLIVAAARRR